MKTKLVKAFLSLITLMISGWATAQPAHLFTRYTSGDGISQKTITSILQDQKGNMWFATWDGINKFDGYRFKNYKASPGDLTGLTNNRIVHISEDRYGFIWLLNYDGEVFRFNPQTGEFHDVPYNQYRANALYVLPSGEVWITTEHEGLIRVETDPVSLTLSASNFLRADHTPVFEQVNRIAQDSNRNQWILTSNGIYQLLPDSPVPVSFFVENLQRNNAHHQPFYDLLEREKEIFFSSHQGKLWVYQKQGGRFTLIQLPTSSHVVTVNALPDNRLLLGTYGDGFLVYDPEDQYTEHYKVSPGNQLSNNYVKSVYIDRSGEAWIELKGRGITHFDPESRKITYYNFMERDGSVFYIQDDVFIHEDGNDNLWVHPAGGGFSYYDRSKKELVPFYDRSLYPGFNTANRMTAVFSDKQGNLWLSSSNNGTEKVTFNYNAFTLFQVNKDDQEPIQNEVRTVFEDRDGLIWIGSKDSIIRIYTSEMEWIGCLTSTGKIAKGTKDALGMAYSITQDRNGVIWIGTKGSGLIVAEPVSKDRYHLSFYRHNTNDIYSISDNNVYCVYEDNKGKIWLATYGGGLNYIDYDRNGQLIFMNHRNHLKNYPVNQCYRTRFITSDYEGNIWVGTTKGILSFKDDFVDPERIIFNHYTRVPGDIQSLSNNDVHHILLTSKKELYLATFGGGLNKLIEFDNDKAIFEVFSSRDGLSSDILQSIVEDRNGNLWIATEEGICKFVPEDHSIENYSSRFFPAAFWFNEGNAIFTRSGKLLFNTNKGVLGFNPDEVSKSTYVPHIVFSQFQLGDKVVSPGEENGILAVDIDDTPGITLSHKNNIFTIQYAALDMKYPEDIEYAYRLSGFEEDWNEVGKRRTATYTNLPKGKYTFQVRSTNSDGVWVENTRSIGIRILPSFWETPWAVLLYTLGLIAIVLVTVYILFTFYRLKNEVTVEQKVSDLKLRFFTNISHELRTPLTLIAGPIEQVLRFPGLQSEVHEQLLLVEKNTNRMLRLVNQILDFRKIQNKKMKMHVRQISMVPFIRHIMESFYALADEQEIEFLLESPDTPVILWADADKLEKVVFNLLSNAFKYTPAGKQIKVTIVESSAEISVSVSDQGIGISENKQKSLFVRFENLVDKNLFNQPTSGIGLSLVKELVEMHKGRITMKSCPGEGSNFTVIFPRDNQHFDPDTEFILTDSASGEVLTELPWEIPAVEAGHELTRETGKQTLLLVEDNAELRFFLKSIFLKHFTIIEAGNGQEGLQKAVELNPDLIISDVMMPEMDGIEMMKALRADMNTSHILVVLLTAKSNIESKIEGLEFGADDYITKPFSAAYLRARVLNLLEQRSKLQALYCARLIPAPGQTREEQKEIEVPVLLTAEQKFMDRLMELMETHMDNGSLSVEDLAAELGMSRSVFFKKLKSLIGLSPIEFIKEVRMKRAAELIEKGGNNMAQIAYMVGVNDPHYFSRCFKQVFSMTPTEYKELKRGKDKKQE